MTFEHIYTFANEGPSYTIKETIVMLYIPIRPDILIEITDSGIPCKDAGESQSVQIGVVPAEIYTSVNCSDTKCRTYECEIASGWQKGDGYSKEIKIKMTFLIENVNLETHTDFAYFTHAKIKGNGKMNIEQLSKDTNRRIRTTFFIDYCA